MIAAVAIACYTNLAGMVIAATPVKIECGRVMFDGGATGVRALPLEVFPASEQARIRAAVGVREVPRELKALAIEIARQRRRAEARAKAGRMTPEKLSEYRENLTEGWRHAVDSAKLSDEEKSYWKEACP